jgi:hypothetical protein
MLTVTLTHEQLRMVVDALDELADELDRVADGEPNKHDRLLLAEESDTLRALAEYIVGAR